MFGLEFLGLKRNIKNKLKRLWRKMRPEKEETQG